MTRIFLALLFFFNGGLALAQETPEAERSYFLGFVEDQLSTPDRQIRINNIQGVLSSNATIGEITIADREGVWLRIVNARIVWTRRALLLGRLEIDTLAADRIEVLRKPLPAEGVAPEASGFQVPELPVSVRLDALAVPNVSFGEGVFGLASQLSINGRLQLVDGSLDTAFEVTRLDGPGGQLALTATYANDTRVLDLDLSLSEPANGIVANLLGIEGRPPVALTLKGQGPVDTLDLALTLDAEGARVLAGTTRLRREAAGLAFDANVGGPISRLIAPAYRAFFGAETRLVAAGVFKDGGGLRLDKLDLASAALTVAAVAETTADGFLQRLDLKTVIANPSVEAIVLPVPGGATTVNRAAVSVAYGTGGGDAWFGSVEVDALTTESFFADKVAITLGGLAQDISQPATRRLTFSARGGATGIIATRADVAEALGESINLEVDGSWRAGEPVRLAKAAVVAKAAAVTLAGDIANNVFSGKVAVNAASLVPFSGIAGRPLAGAIDLDSSGSLTPLSGGFDLTLDGVASDLAIGTPAADNLLRGETRLTGRIARSQTGLMADRFSVFNDQISLTANGSFASEAADFGFDFSLADLKLVSERASGQLTAKGRAVGTGGRIKLTFDAAVPVGTLVDKPLRDAAVRFDGMLAAGDLMGLVSGSGVLSDVPIDLRSRIDIAADGERKLTGLTFSAGGARANGDLVQTAEGLFTGHVAVAADDISTVAALVLAKASGGVDADLTLTIANGEQNIATKARVTDLAYDTIRVGRADLEATIEDLFNVPAISGSATANDVLAGGIEVAKLDARATKQGDATNFNATATLKNGTEAVAEGALAPVEGGYRVSLTSASLVQGALSARLFEPTAVVIRGQAIALDGLAVDVGGGRVEASGMLGEQLDLKVRIAALPLAIANTIRPDLELAGTVDATATIAGTRAAPEVAFNIQSRSIAAAALRRVGLKSVAIDATGKSTQSVLNIDAAVTSPDGLRAVVTGDVPLDPNGKAALEIDLEALPLGLLNAVVPGQDLSGVVSGTARVSGRLADPSATFDIRAVGVQATALASAGIPRLDAVAAGSFADRTLDLSQASIAGPDGLSGTVLGTIPLDGGTIAVDVRLAAFPLGTLNTVVPGQSLAGTITGSAQVTGTLADPAATFDLSGNGLRAAPLAKAGIENLDANAAGSFANRTLTLASTSISGPDGLGATVSGTIPLAGGPMAVDVRLAAFPLGVLDTIVPAQDLGGTITGSARLTGTLADPTATFELSGSGLRAAPLAQAGIASLDAKAAGSFANRTLTLASASISGPGGLGATVSGTIPFAGGPMAVDVRLAAFPLSALNGLAPGQDLGGTITGSARVSGTLANPAATFELSGNGLRAAPLAEAGIDSLAANANGSFADRTLTLASFSISGPQGLAATASGTVPFNGRPMAVDVRLAAFPLSALDGLAPGQDLGGTISGTARVSGTVADPAATFELDGKALKAAPLARAGIGSVDLRAAGSFAKQAVSLTSLSVTGPLGLTLSASGRVPFAGEGLALDVRAQAPLALANRFLADRGAQLSGQLSASVSVSGSLRKPVLRGSFETAGAQFVDPQSNVRLSGLSLQGSIDGDRVTLRSASASVGGGGTVSAGGNISTSAQAGFPADLRVTLDNVRYADGNLVVATVSGSLALTGPLLRDPRLSGDIQVARAEITVPDSLGGGATAIDVRHIRPPADVAATLKRARANDGTPMPSGRPSVLRLDVNVTAPNKIFVRGRGLDAELGGAVRLTGPVTDIQPVGSFDLIRGRLSILGQRITFDEGRVSLVGDLDPFLDFVARTDSDDISVFITVRGRVSDLDISFSSQPNLPQDEVLARLIFNRGLSELSALQIAQLAAAAAELAGGSNASLLGGLREATGLDDLDVITDSEGNAAVRAGRYIQDNVYLGLEAGGQGSTRATITLDVTEDLKVRGAAGTDSSLGVFYEKDY